MDCPTVKSLLDAVEKGHFDRDLEVHLGECQACSSVVSALRDETEGLTISVGALWLRERISCPHPDILTAFADQALDEEEADFIRFHLETVECPHCSSNLASIESSLAGESPERIDKARDAAMQRSAAFLKNR